MIKRTFTLTCAILMACLCASAGDGDITIGGEPVKKGSPIPFLQKGNVYFDGDNKLTMENAVINAGNREGILASEGIVIELIGENHINAKGDALTVLYDDSFICGDGELYINSSAGYGISIEEMLEVYDRYGGSIKLNVYGKNGAIDGRRRYTSHYGWRCGYLDPSGNDIILNSDGDHPVVHDIENIVMDFSAFVYDSYWYDPDQRTVVYGYDETPVTKEVRIVDANAIEDWDIEIMGSSVNNYNAQHFDPQNLWWGDIEVVRDAAGGEAKIFMDAAYFKTETVPDFEAIYARGYGGVDIWVNGACYLPSWQGIFINNSGRNNSCGVLLYGQNEKSMFVFGGGIYLEGNENVYMTVRRLVMHVTDCYISSQDDCVLLFDNCDVTLTNDDSELIEDINLNLRQCHFQRQGDYYDEDKRTVCHSDGTPAKEQLRIVRDASATGINASEAVAPQPAASCNLQGQRVGADYRGLVIENGRKVLKR